MAQFSTQQTRYKNGILVYFTGQIVIKKYVLILITAFIGVLTLTLVLVSSIRFSSKEQDIIKTSTQTSILSTTTTTEDPFGNGPWQNSSLTDIVEPLNYDILLRFNYINQEISYDGDISIYMRNNLDNNENIVMHADSILQPEDPLVYLIDEKTGQTTQLTIKSNFQYNKYDYYVIILSQKLKKNDLLRVDLQFERDIGKSESEGMFFTTYLDSNDTRQYVKQNILLRYYFIFLYLKNLEP
jgi:hypothetical protein